MPFDIVNVRQVARDQRSTDSLSVNMAHQKFLDRANELYAGGTCESYYAARQQAKREYRKKGYDF